MIWIYALLIIIAITITIALGRLITVSRGDHAAPFGERGDTITIAPQTGVADDTGLPPEMQPAPLPDMLPAPVLEQGEQPCQTTLSPSSSPAGTAASASMSVSTALTASTPDGPMTTTATMPVLTANQSPSPQPDDELAERTPTPDELAKLEAATQRLLDRAAAADLATAELLGDPIWAPQEPFMAMLSDETIARGNAGGDRMKARSSAEKAPYFDTTVSADVDVSIDPGELHDAGWHHESECAGTDAALATPLLVGGVSPREAIASLHRQAHPGQGHDPATCREEPCRSLPLADLTVRLGRGAA